jgi:hypothetical protein
MSAASVRDGVRVQVEAHDICNAHAVYVARPLACEIAVRRKFYIGIVLLNADVCDRQPDTAPLFRRPQLEPLLCERSTKLPQQPILNWKLAFVVLRIVVRTKGHDAWLPTSARNRPAYGSSALSPHPILRRHVSARKPAPPTHRQHQSNTRKIARKSLTSTIAHLFLGPTTAVAQRETPWCHHGTASPFWELIFALPPVKSAAAAYS